MSDKSADAGYLPTIGIECHVQLKTCTKLFSSTGIDARSAEPNTLISHIDAGLPGALPVLNKKAVELAAIAAFALNTSPQTFSAFDRKHYFYPDLPKGYQITQYSNPIIKGGYIEIINAGQKKIIHIDRAHLEEDAGKSTHPEGADYSLVDLNRAGTPLLEIVSQPQIHSSEEAKAYSREMYLIMKYAGVSDGNLYRGNMRFDVNISLSRHKSRSGKRAEIKNLNSFRSVENAVKYEINRQTEILIAGGEIIQETRGWDDSKQKTISQRGKEEAHDYRYMPEPDVPPINFSDDWLRRIKQQLPELPSSIRGKLTKTGISESVVEDLLDNPEIVFRLLKAIKITGTGNIKHMAFDYLRDEEILSVSIDDHIAVAEMLSNNAINSSAAVDLLAALKVRTGARQLATELNLMQISDDSKLEDLAKKVIAANPQAVNDIKAGAHKAIGFLVGQVMQASQGRANPQIVNMIIKQLIGL